MISPRQEEYCGGLLAAAAECGHTPAVQILASASSAEVNAKNEVSGRRGLAARVAGRLVGGKDGRNRDQRTG